MRRLINTVCEAARVHLEQLYVLSLVLIHLINLCQSFIRAIYDFISELMKVEMASFLSLRNSTSIISLYK